MLNVSAEKEAVGAGSGVEAASRYGSASPK
jgi:hypothetical protein